MDYQKELKKLIAKNNGIIMSKDLKEYNIPRQYLNRFLKEDKLEKVERGVEVHTVKKEFYSIGVIEKETNFDRVIKVYNKERTICDILKNRNNMDPSLLNTAIRNYLTGKGKNIPKLLDYSKKLRIKTILRRYLEMFL